MNRSSIGMSLFYFVIFWQAFNDVALATGLGVALGFAFHNNPETQKEENEHHVE